MARADALIFTLYEWLRLGIAWIFVMGIALVSGRALIVGVLALIEKLRPAPPEQPGLPAAGERADSRLQRGRRHRATRCESALASDYPAHRSGGRRMTARPTAPANCSTRTSARIRACASCTSPIAASPRR